MSTLKDLKFKKLLYSSFGGAPLFLSLWNRFDFSILLTQSGIFKSRGISTWKLAFLFVVGLMARCNSCLHMVQFYEKENLLQRIFIYRLFDHCSDKYVNALNIVVLHAFKSSGLQYPLLYSVWKQDNNKDPHQSKLDLAFQMLQQLRDQLTAPVKCWVEMDSWYYVKSLYLGIEQLGFNWVTRAKSNSTLYRKVKIRGVERFITIYPEVLFKEKTGKSKQIIALLLSNEMDAKPETIVQVYKKRWSIEVFFRNGKQELGLNDCHSTDENHIHAHLSLLMVAESLVRFAQWKYNGKTDIEEEVTHGQVVALLFHTRCEVLAKSKDTIQVKRTKNHFNL